MIELETRQIRILSSLLKQKYTKLDLLSMKMELSLNTLVSEINTINYEFKRKYIDVEISNHHSKGYAIEGADTKSFKTLKDHCEAYLDLAVHTHFYRNERALWLARYFITLDGSVKSERLASTMMISLATLNKDLRVVRKFLSLYQIEIVSIPYKGMHLKGNTMALRAALLDCCDLYNYKEFGVLPQRFIDELKIDETQFSSINSLLIEKISKHNIKLGDIGFKRVLLYLVLLNSGVFKEDSEEVIISNLHNCRFYKLSEEILGDKYSVKEVELLTIFIIVNVEIKELSDDFIQTIMPSSYKMCLELNVELKRISGFDLTHWDAYNDYMTKFITIYLIKKRYNIFHYMTSINMRKYLRLRISTYSFAKYIYHILNKSDNDQIAQEVGCYELASAVFGLSYTLRNKYHQTNIGLLSGIGFNSETVLKARALINITHNTCSKRIYEYELDRVKELGFDAVIVSDSVKVDTSKVDVPVFVMDGDGSVRFQLWEELLTEKRVVKVLRPYLDSAVQTYLDTSKDIEEQILCAFEKNGLTAVKDRNEFKNLIRLLIYDGINSRSTEIKIINLFSPQDLEKKYYVFYLSNVISDATNRIAMIQFLFTDTKQGEIILKNGDSELRRYFNL